MLLKTPQCNFNWQAPNFTLKDFNGQIFEMQKNIGKTGILIAFICNHCPYVKKIATRFVTDCNELSENGINILAIMPNDYQTYPDDNPKNMALFSQKYKFNFPYLVDENQEVAKAYDAVCTPDFFILNAAGRLQYRGRLDDAAMGDDTQRKRELVEAAHQIAKTGQGPKQQIPSMGCSIKWH